MLMGMSAPRKIGQVLSSPVPGQDETIRGWIYRTRSSGAIVFAVVRDSSGIIQVTVKKGNLPEGEFEAAKSALADARKLASAEQKRALDDIERDVDRVGSLASKADTEAKKAAVAATKKIAVLLK
jgi:aspartyl/asparaginyl-tRNA synthetase